MKKIIFFSSTILLLLSLSLYSFTPDKAEIKTNKIEWLTLEEALLAQQKNDKKIFIDMYTSWCHWCKVMDKKTFTDPNVIRYINENFYAVKFDAEQKAPITFKGKTYEFIPTTKRGIHALAYELSNKQMSYPSFILLDENLNHLGIIKGYKAPEPFLDMLKKKVNKAL